MRISEGIEVDKTAGGLFDIRYWVIDVDGTMTDGSLYYDNNGNELKKFNTRDGAGFFMAHAAGMQIIVLTGRECKATERRVEELGADYLFQNVKNKKRFLQEFMEKENISKEEIAYIGDDLVDLPAMRLVNFIACPKDACREVREISDFISEIKGGYGVVSDVVSYVLKQRGEWERAMERVYPV